MRDVRGRYGELKDFAETGPEWAHGCESCTYGLVVASEIIGTLTLSDQRAVQMDEGMIEFCECKAAFMYRQYLRKILAAMHIDTRKSYREHILAARVPSMHYDEVAA